VRRGQASVAVIIPGGFGTRRSRILRRRREAVDRVLYDPSRAVELAMVRGIPDRARDAGGQQGNSFGGSQGRAGRRAALLGKVSKSVHEARRSEGGRWPRWLRSVQKFYCPASGQNRRRLPASPGSDPLPLHGA
jgi:hypothetical protein